MNRRNKEKQAGFSLVEVVVSTAILFSVAGVFLAMTAANGKLLAREHSLVPGLLMNCQPLPKRVKEAQQVKHLKSFFRGMKEDALEVFSGYKVTDENGDGMTYYKRGDP